MKELDHLESQPNLENPNEVFNNLLELTGEPAAPKIIERDFDCPDIRRIIIFGEPGANKTTILLQLATELISIDHSIEPKFVFYDNAVARVKSEVGIPNLRTRAHFDLASQILSAEMDKSLISGTENKTSRPIQFVELVGIGAKNRGKSSLKGAAEKVRDQSPMTQDTLIIGVAADERSLKDAGTVRKAVAELEDPLQVFDLLSTFNIHLTDYPKDIPLRTAAERIIEFFGKMAAESRIDIIHREVAALARQKSAEDDDRLFRILRLPTLKYPIEEIGIRKSYLLNAAFLQAYLEEMGLKRNMYDASFGIEDKGLVLFSPYNPEIPKNIDLSQVL